MMKKTLLVLLSGIALASMASTVEARRHCKTKAENVCAPKCAPKCEVTCCTEVTPEVHGVLCKAVKGHRYIPQDNKCCKKYTPCPPKRCCRMVPQPDKIEIEWVKKEICVPQPDIEEVYYEEQPDKCCDEWVPCPPKCVECIEYIPVKVNIDPPCLPSANTCERSSDASNIDEDMEMEK